LQGANIPFRAKHGRMLKRATEAEVRELFEKLLNKGAVEHFYFRENNTANEAKE
jgi:hypothetical protein